MLSTIWSPSQNYSPGPRAVLAHVIHDTEGHLAGALAALKAAGGPSAHYIVDRDGTAYQLVAEEDTAYHVAAWGSNPALNRGRPDWLPPYNGLYSAVNACTIGYELVGFAATGFTGEQYRTLGTLIMQACQRWDVPATLLPDAGTAARIVTHGWLQTDRSDPGPLFDWEQLRAAIAAEMGEIPVSEEDAALLAAVKGSGVNDAQAYKDLTDWASATYQQLTEVREQLSAALAAQHEAAPAVVRVLVRAGVTVETETVP